MDVSRDTLSAALHNLPSGESARRIITQFLFKSGLYHDCCVAVNFLNQGRLPREIDGTKNWGHRSHKSCTV